MVTSLPTKNLSRERIFEVSSLEEGLEVMRNNFSLKTPPMWNVLMNDNGRLIVYDRFNQPCYGEMRTYGSTHPGDCTRPNDPRPSDLFTPFPNGNPIAVGRTFYPKNQTPSFLLDPNESPFRIVLKDFEVDSKYLLIKDTDVDPTVLVNLFRKLYHCNYSSQYFKENYGEKLAYLFDHITYCKFEYKTGGFSKGRFIRDNSFNGFLPFNVRRWWNGNPRSLSNGRTFKEREAYNRPEIDNMFNHTPEDLDTRFVWDGPITEKDFDAFATKLMEYVNV